MRNLRRQFGDKFAKALAKSPMLVADLQEIRKRGIKIRRLNQRDVYYSVHETQTLITLKGVCFLLLSLIRNFLTSIYRPTVRLPVGLPWSVGKIAKTYSVAVLLYIVGTIMPIVLWFGFLWYEAYRNPALVEKLLSTEALMPMLVAVTVVSFLCGFSLEVWYLRRSMRRDGLSLSKMVALNLDSLGGKISKLRALGKALLWALGAFALANLINLALEQVCPIPKDPAADFAKSIAGGSFMLIALLMIVAAPFLEELIFRGFFYNSLRSSLRVGSVRRFLPTDGAADFCAAMISGIAFGAAHLNLTGMPFYVALGMLSAELYRRSGSLIPSMLLHALNNFVGVLLISKVL